MAVKIDGSSGFVQRTERLADTGLAAYWSMNNVAHKRITHEST